MILTSALYLTMVKNLAALSSNQAGLLNSDFFSIANLLMERITKEVLKTREEYLMYTDSIPIVAGQASYRIPYRSVDGRVRHLWFEDANGDRNQLQPDYFENIDSYSSTSRDSPTRFYISSNSIVFLPAPNTSGGNLVCVYPFRPSQMVDSTTTSTVTAVNYATNTITVANVPSNFTSGLLYDIVEHRSGNNIVSYDLAGTVSGSTIAFAAAIPNVAVGNIVALAGQSSVPMLPECAHTLLLEASVLRIEELRGNVNRIKSSLQRVTDETDTCRSLLASRVISKAPPAGGGNPALPRRMI